MTVKKGKHQTFTRNALFVNLLLSENILFCILSKVHWFTIIFFQDRVINKTKL